jgi:hypothetical protein
MTSPGRSLALVLATLLLPVACTSIAGLVDVPDVDGSVATDATGEGDDAAGDGTSSGGPSDGSSERSQDARPPQDAGGADSPTMNDGPPRDDAPPDGPGPVGCANSNAIFCEDFEEGLDANTWSDQGDIGATVVVDGTKPHRGLQSLHATTFAIPPDAASFSPYAQLTHPVVLPPTVYIRTWVYLSAFPMTQNESFVLAMQDHANFLGLEVEVQQGEWAITDWVSGVNDHQSAPANAMNWHCVEWLLQQSDGGTNGATDVWLDGQEFPGLHLTSLPVPDLEWIKAGIAVSVPPPQTQYELFIDDIYVDNSPVGCAK